MKDTSYKIHAFHYKLKYIMYNNVKNVRTLSYTTLRLIWQERKENNHKDFWQKERKKPKLKKNVGLSTRIKGKLLNMNQY